MQPLIIIKYRERITIAQNISFFCSSFHPPQKLRVNLQNILNISPTNGTSLACVFQIISATFAANKVPTLIEKDFRIGQIANAAFGVCI